VLTEIRRAWEAWKYSLLVLARSPALVGALIVFTGLWGGAAYAWLGLPESSTLILLLTLLWALAQAAIAVAVFAGAIDSLSEAAWSSLASVRLRALARFDRRQMARCGVWLIAAFLIIFLLSAAFSWANDHALDVASFLTLHSGKPVSQVPVGWLFQVIEAFVWLVLTGFLFSFLNLLLREGWGAARRAVRRTLAACTWRAPLLTTLLAAVIFAGGANKLAVWHPIVPPGFWDYTQVLVRLGGALVWLVMGFLLEVLSLARLARPRSADSSPAL